MLAEDQRQQVALLFSQRGERVHHSLEFPKPLTAGRVQAADVVITMGCGDACPVYPGKRYLDWDLPDPAGRTVEQIRPIRDEISARVRALIRELAG
jgi:arsenate reductase (thioredoxin)